MASTDPEVSVIMPTLNAVKYLTESLPAILNQTHSNFEVLILDGGSTDGTLEYIQSLNDPRIVLYENTGGIVKSLNRGVEAASGHFIARADGDSVPEPTWLQRCVEFLRSRPAYAAVGTQAKRIKPDGSSYVTDKPEEHASIVKGLIKSNPMIHPTMVIRKSMMNRVGGYRDRHWEDYDLIIRLSEHYRLENIPEALVKDYLHGESVVGETTRTKSVIAGLRCRFLALRVSDLPVTTRLRLVIEKSLAIIS